MSETSSEVVQGTAAGRTNVAAELRSMPVPWGTLLASGIFGVVFGAAVLIWPDVTVRVMAALTGVWLFTIGIARIIGAFLPGRGSVARHLLSGIVGVVVLVAGLVCLRDLVTRLAVLALLFAITWILSGITEVVLAVQRTGAARWGLLGVGLLSVAAGVVFVLMPDVSLATLVLLTGGSSLIVGVAEVLVALFLRMLAGKEDVEPAADAEPYGPDSPLRSHRPEAAR